MAVFNLPVNSVSFGQVSTGLLREAFRRIKEEGEDDQHYLLPIGGSIDLDTQKEDKEFSKWIVDTIQKPELNKAWDKSATTVKLWHLNYESFSFPTSSNRKLISFYELDKPTPAELNIIKNADKVFFTSDFTVKLFRSLGCDNIEYLPLFFDSHNFHQTNKSYHQDDRISFNLVGKFEKRKHHLKALKAWCKRFGGDKKYFLNCSIYNHFLSQEENNAALSEVFSGKEKPFNTNFLPWMKENQVYNDYLNSADIVIGMSGGEGWGLPEFHSVAMGSHAVVLNCNGYQSWANEKNSVLVNPEGTEPAHDGRFFIEGRPYNQGNIFTWKEDEFIAACEEAIKRVEENRVNQEGLKLQEDFTVKQTLDQLL